MVEFVASRTPEEHQAVKGGHHDLHSMEPIERTQSEGLDGASATPQRVLALIKKEISLRSSACDVFVVIYNGIFPF
ncbi:hypothetical protein HU200_005520 [Digitaria exilis]|uniref:Uncharacterized protein n=1 Tax=Digitaria exilis TaxID=1010633 RepID=A0A835KSR7_9POAL|nr:hypothetical protein HU200_005520 [Digitaria exilis]